MAERILIVEDESKIARFIELELKHEGYEVEIANNGRDGLEKGLSGNFDLMVLDLMLPLMSGVEVCRRIRKESNMKIIMLTAKDDVSDKVMGLDTGADDYMTKPFAIEELLARIRVHLKNISITKVDKDILEAGKLVVSKKDYSVKYDNDNINLSKTEFDLLLYLMENTGVAVSRDSIINSIWGYEFVGETNVVDVYIRYLRTKIDEKYNKKYIRTVRGVGYIFKNEE